MIRRPMRCPADAVSVPRGSSWEPVGRGASAREGLELWLSGEDMTVGRAHEVKGGRLGKGARRGEELVRGRREDGVQGHGGV